jgi:RNA polymerase sigma-70 factor (ECF subfamily)
MMELHDEIPTRRSLLTRLKNWSDDGGWQRFFDTYWRLIYSAAVKSGLTDPEAQDVVQETVLSVSKSMRRAAYQSDRGSFKNWLLRLTRWQVNRQLRKKYQDARLPRHQPRTSTSTRTGTVERVPAPDNLSFEEVWEEEWEQNLLELALQRVRTAVDARQYQIFDMYVLKEWPVARVCEALQVSAARVYMAKHRVGRLLKKEVSRLRAKPI